MKIILKDFGPISIFEFSLDKDLNVIFGRNNIGKSYGITAVYLVLKNLLEHAVEMEPDISRFAEYINARMTDDIGYDITDDIEDRLVSSLNGAFILSLENSFKNSFGAIGQLSNKFSRKEFSIYVEFDSFRFCMKANDGHLHADKFTLTYTVTADAGIHSNGRLFYYREEGPYRSIDACMTAVYAALNTEVNAAANDVYFLPASRSGLYLALNAFGPLMAELSRSRSFLKSKVELPTLTEPVADYFLNLSSIDKSSKTGFQDIINAIEQDILQGSILFNDETKKITFRQREMDSDTDLVFSSSMVAEIAPVVAYLKYVIQYKEHNQRRNPDGIPGSYGLLFIEEPEAHLHPEIQVKLMEMFAALAGRNLKIIMTSHSNYMFNKLSNMVLDDKIAPDKVGAYLMRETAGGSISDNVSMQADSDGMNDENFADVASMLYEERIRIYDRLNDAQHAD